MAKKKVALQENVGAAIIDVNRTVLVASGAAAAERRMQGILRALVEAKRISQSYIADKLHVPASHVSRWLTGKLGKRGYQLPFWALAALSELLDRQLFVALTDIQSVGKSNRPPQATDLLQQFFLGMAHINPQEGPLAVARHIATVWNAKSWSFYRENPRRNILEWCGDASTIRLPELMEGPSWISELPTRVVRLYEQEQLSSRRPNSAAHRFFQFEWSQEQSAFVLREKIGFCVAIPFLADGLRTAVLFLNFEKRPGNIDLMHEPLLIAVNQLQGAIQQTWPVPRPTGTMQRGESSFREILRLLEASFSSLGNLQDAENSVRIDDGISRSLVDVCENLWQGLDKSCDVFALEHEVECLTKEPGELRFSGKCDADLIVRRAAGYGETYYIEDLSRNPIRSELDPESRIPASQLQRIVVPIRCEATGTSRDPVEANWRSESPGNHKVFRYAMPGRNSVVSWGALSVDSDERFFSPVKALELSMVTHLLACALYFPKLVKVPDGRGAAEQRQRQEFFQKACEAVLETVNHLNKSEDDAQRGRRDQAADTGPVQGPEASNGPLQPLCQAVVDKGLIAGAERCDIYPYDHLYRQFRKGGSYLSPEWVDELRKKYPELLDCCDSVRYLKPRPGGNSERLLGLVDEYHFILEAEKHPRVSPITKVIGTRALIGCSCRVGSSLKADGVLWLGFRQELLQDRDNCSFQEMLPRLRAIAHIAAILCAALRWWGSSWPTSASL